MIGKNYRYFLREIYIAVLILTSDLHCFCRSLKIKLLSNFIFCIINVLFLLYLNFILSKNKIWDKWKKYFANKALEYSGIEPVPCPHASGPSVTELSQSPKKPFLVSLQRWPCSGQKLSGPAEFQGHFMTQVIPAFSCADDNSRSLLLGTRI